MIVLLPLEQAVMLLIKRSVHSHSIIELSPKKSIKL